MTDSQPARGCELKACPFCGKAPTLTSTGMVRCDTFTQHGDGPRCYCPVMITEPGRWNTRVAGGSEEVTEAMVRAASESCAKDDEGEFPPLCDLIGYSGENKTRTVIRAALVAALQVKP